MFRSAIGLALLATLSLNSCGRRSAAPITSINDEPAPPAEGPRINTFAAVAAKVRPAVVVLATFDEHGGLIANQHGFFISADGDLVAERSAMNNAASAIVKSADGRAYDIFGTYVRSSAPDFILLKTNARNVPNLDDFPAAATVPDGAAAAVVLSSASNAPSSLLEGKITGRKSDSGGEWLNFEPSPPKTALGAPVIDENGAIIGIVARHNEMNAVFRYGDATSALTVEASPEDTPMPEVSTMIASPAEGVTRTAPLPRASASPKVSLHRGRKLLYAPAPHYPQKRAWTNWNLRGSGIYRVTFNAQGEANEVEVTRSSGDAVMDNEAVQTLRSWQAEPGQGWSLTVPVTFQQ
jgi:TonB family protein